MIVVSDTSPILNLARIGRLDLLRLVYQQVLIPVAVHDELLAAMRPLPTPIDFAALPWLTIARPSDRHHVERLSENLDIGEAEAIVLAIEWRVQLLLVDERRGRRIATEAGLAVTGLLGVVAHAKRACQTQVMTGGRFKHPGRHFQRSTILLVVEATPTDGMTAFRQRLVHRDRPSEPWMPRVTNLSRLSTMGVALSTCITNVVDTRPSARSVRPGLSARQRRSLHRGGARRLPQVRMVPDSTAADRPAGLSLDYVGRANERRPT